MKKFREIFSFDLVSSIVMLAFGGLIVLADIFLCPPVTISTVVLGGLLTVVGIIGLILNLTNK